MAGDPEDDAMWDDRVAELDAQGGYDDADNSDADDSYSSSDDDDE